MAALDLTGLIASGFLDDLDRYAKSDEEFTVCALWYVGDSPEEVVRQDLTRAEYDALDRDTRRTIMEAPSATRYLETSGKSNA